MKHLKCLAFALGLTTTTISNADIHTWHHVYSKQGTWQGKLSIISGNQAGYFVDENKTNVGKHYEFDVTPSKKLTYGFGFDYEHTDFNVAYSLTLYQNNTFTAKACVFNITAAGPGVPDVRILAYNGAKCTRITEGKRSLNFIAE